VRGGQIGMIVAVVLVGGGCGGNGGIDIADARIGQPSGPNAALYFTATSTGAPDRLVGATTTAAAAVQLHETTSGGDGTTGMRPIESLDLPPGGSLVLEPGGHHLMLIEVDRLEVGDTVEVTVSWDTEGDMVIAAAVVDPGDTVGDG